MRRWRSVLGDEARRARLRASLWPVRAARLSAPPPGLPELLEYRAVPPFYTLSRRHGERATRARGGGRPPRARPAPPRGRPALRLPPPPPERSRDTGRGPAAGAGGSQAGAGGSGRGASPPRGVVRPGSGTH